MSAGTVILNEQAEELMDQLRTLLAFGPVPTDELLYVVERTAGLFAANLAKYRRERVQVVFQPADDESSPAMADLIGH